MISGNFDGVRFQHQAAPNNATLVNDATKLMMVPKNESDPGTRNAGVEGLGRTRQPGIVTYE